MDKAGKWIFIAGALVVGIVLFKSMSSGSKSSGSSFFGGTTAKKSGWEDLGSGFGKFLGGFGNWLGKSEEEEGYVPNITRGEPGVL